MSSRLPITELSSHWQEQLRTAVTSTPELLQLLDLREDQLDWLEGDTAGFALKVPHSFVRRMHRGDPDDPLLRQVLATPDEKLATPGYSTDPVGEQDNANPVPGLIHKYRGRLLLVVAGGCAVNCRYCFRRHFPYEDNRNGRRDWQAAYDYIRAQGDIEEVIFSGGDPLVATDRHLHDLVQGLSELPGLKRLRIHSRVPVVLPDRVTTALLRALSASPLQTIMVLHSNHANEIDDSVATAVGAMRDAGMTVLNQAVLLRGVNDSVAAQVALAETLFEAGILPYYLHLLDKVQGAAHFDAGTARARDIHREMAARLPGYLVPRLVREEAGAPAKTPVGTTR